MSNIAIRGPITQQIWKTLRNNIIVYMLHAAVFDIRKPKVLAALCLIYTANLKFSYIHLIFVE